MKARELRDLSDAELRDHIRDRRRELFGLRFQHATGELDNTASLRRAKREVARALTVAREREIERSLTVAREREIEPAEGNG
jgi:large subunit ribosomal protein L29